MSRLSRARDKSRQRLADSKPARTVGDNPALRANDDIRPDGIGIRHGKRAGSDKGQGLWRTTSQNYKTSVTIDSRWTNDGM